MKVSDLITLLQAEDPNETVVVESKDVPYVYFNVNGTYRNVQGVFVISANDQQVDG